MLSDGLTDGRTEWLIELIRLFMWLKRILFNNFQRIDIRYTEMVSLLYEFSDVCLDDPLDWIVSHIQYTW